MHGAEEAEGCSIYSPRQVIREEKIKKLYNQMYGLGKWKFSWHLEFVWRNLLINTSGSMIQVSVKQNYSNDN